MSLSEWQGQLYRDDRLFVLHIAKCTVKPIQNGLVETTIYHEDAPPDHVWCLVTFRNTERYPVARVDHFDSFAEASAYLQRVEPTVPLISLGGQPSPTPMAYPEWCEWKARQGWKDYNYREMYTPGGDNPCEVVIQRRT